jgi:5-methylcytosine-specific restriction enzyme subunit McrC
MNMQTPEILIVKEYEPVEVDPSLYMDGPQLSIYPEVLERDYISIRWKKGKPIFYAGGYVGVIPVNARFTLDVRPKVPLDNLERIIKLSNHSPFELSGLEREYATHREASGPIEDFLIDSFVDKVELLVSNGLFRKYEKRSDAGSFPKGRIDFTRTVRLQARGAVSLAYSWEDRHIDIPQNRLLKLALLRCLQTDSASRSRKRRARVAQYLEYFEPVRDCDLLTVLETPDIEKLPDTRLYYQPALALAKLILQGNNLGFSSSDQTITANSLLLDLDVAFEAYIRHVLEDLNKSTRNFRVFDGNIGGDEGRRKKLLSPSGLQSQLAQTVTATPDIVIEVHAPPKLVSNIVLDMKYKNKKTIADREDLNQLISYAASYDSCAGVFVFPAREENQGGLQCLGTVAQVPIFQYFINLGAPNIEEEEAALRRMVNDVFDQSNSIRA